MRVPELKSLAGDRGLRNYSRMRKAELAALFQNNGTPEGPRALQAHPPPGQNCASTSPTPRTRSPSPPPQRRAAM